MDENQVNDTNTDDKEWEQAGLDFLADRGIESDKSSKEQESIDDQEETKKDPADESSSDEDSNVQTGEEGQPDDGTKPADKKPEGTEATPQTAPQPAPDPDAAERAQRRAQLALEADRKELANDIKQQMFSDRPEKLLDAEGREIKTAQDVTQYRNPVTGKNFTLEEGAQWLMAAQRNLEDGIQNDQKEIDRIVDVNLTVKEEAQEVMELYGDLLQQRPGLRKEVWEDYKKTLQLSEDGEVIVGAPLSMKRFYDTVLSPHVAYATHQQKMEAEKAEAEKKEAARKAAQEKKQDQSDREDIFSTRTKTHEGMDPEEKEWAGVAKEYYES